MERSVDIKVQAFQPRKYFRLVIIDMMPSVSQKYNKNKRTKKGSGECK